MKYQYKRPSVPSRLGIGPMSRNVLDAAIRMAYRHQRTVMVIASRSQVECGDLGGGYVEGWSTEQFTAYIRSQDPAGLVRICRDHGGPWQHPNEVASGLDETDAMASSLASLCCDIRSGVELLHIDTSREGGGSARFESAVDRLTTLYGECQELANTYGRQIAFEVGLEKQSSDPDDPSEFRAKLECIVGSLARESLQPPTFVVGQTGTKVVGPEFGVIETSAFLALLEQMQLTEQRDDFLLLAYESGAWRKWFDDDASDLQRSIVAGHYVFATDAFREIKQRADVACRKQTRTVDSVLGAALDRAMERYAAEIWNGEHRTAQWTA